MTVDPERRMNLLFFVKFLSHMLFRPYLVILVLLISLTSSQCSRKMDTTNQSKIQFDYSAIDDQGLRNGEVAVDYEFCIPADEAILKEVMKIDPAVRVMKSSHGRIGCSAQQWLCINTTYTPGWKNKLYAIASLNYVEKIKETFYE